MVCCYTKQFQGKQEEDSALLVAPPMTTTYSELDELLSIFSKSVEEMMQKGGHSIA